MTYGNAPFSVPYVLNSNFLMTPLNIGFILKIGYRYYLIMKNSYKGSLLLKLK